MSRILKALFPDMLATRFTPVMTLSKSHDYLRDRTHYSSLYVYGTAVPGSHDQLFNVGIYVGAEPGYSGSREKIHALPDMSAKELDVFFGKIGKITDSQLITSGIKVLADKLYAEVKAGNDLTPSNQTGRAAFIAL
jgi:hypothetical protein